MQEIVIPEKQNSVVKELYFTKENYLSILESVKNEIEKENSGTADADNKKQRSALYGLYYNAFAGLIRSGQLCTRKDGEDAMPVIEIESKGKRYSMSESTLYAIFGQHSETLIHPWKDTSSHPGYIKNAGIFGGESGDPENIYSSKDMDAAVKLAEEKKDKILKETEKSYEKELSDSQKENERIGKKLSDTETKLNKAVKDIEALKIKNEETIKKAENHEKITVKNAVESTKAEMADEIAGLNEKIKELKETSSRTETDYRSYKERTDKELEDRKKYVYDPNYDHYYSEVLPKVVNTLEFSHTDLLVRTGCIIISTLAVVLSLVFAL